MKKIIMLVTFVAIPLCVGAISGFLTRNSMSHYLSLEKPPLSPPGAVFPVVWSILYVLMGIGAYLIYTSKSDAIYATLGLILYYGQLFMNFFWSLIFFRANQYVGALIWLLIMWVTVITMLIMYKKVSMLAFVLNVPLVLWLTFAAYLNAGVIILN